MQHKELSKKNFSFESLPEVLLNFLSKVFRTHKYNLEITYNNTKKLVSNPLGDEIKLLALLLKNRQNKIEFALEFYYGGFFKYTMHHPDQCMWYLEGSKKPEKASQVIAIPEALWQAHKHYLDYHYLGYDMLESLEIKDLMEHCEKIKVFCDDGFAPIEWFGPEVNSPLLAKFKGEDGLFLDIGKYIG